LLSNLFQNDLHDIFDHTCDPVALNDIKLNSLSWADDLVLLSKSKEGLQNCLNKLYDYCSKWNLSVNTDKTKCVTFGKAKNPQIKYNNLEIENVTEYTYLGVLLHKSGKIKYAMEDRVKKAARAANLIQRAISSTGNVSVDIATSLFDKQILPILLYGSIIWGISGTYDKLYLNNVPESITSLSSLKKFLKFDGLKCQKRVGRKGASARKILVTVDSYNTKNKLLHSSFDASEFEDSKGSDIIEKLHAKYCKFALNVNKFASNHAVRAELGRFPVQINRDIKLLKYWHRLENMESSDNELLVEAYKVCKKYNHNWYTNIANFLNRNGLGHLFGTPKKYTENYMVNEVKKVCENMYIQSWDKKSKNDERLHILYNLKKRNYTCSNYLNWVEDIDTRKLVTKLRLGCSKLKSHVYLKSKDEDKCNQCGEIGDDTEHLFLKCKALNSIQQKHIAKIKNVYPDFEKLSQTSKICSLLSLTPFDASCDKQRYYNLCLDFIRDLMKHKWNSSLENE